MDQRAKRIVVTISIIFVIVLSAVAMFFATRPQPQSAVQDTPAVGITVGTDSQTSNLGNLLRREGIPFVVVDTRTIGVRPDDLAEVEQVIEQENTVDGFRIDYVVTSTQVEQPDPDVSVPSETSPPPTSVPSESASPTVSSSPSTDVTSDPSGSPSPEDTTSPGADDPDAPTFELTNVPNPESPTGDAAAIVGYDFFSPSSTWSEDSVMIGSVRYAQTVTFANPAAVEKFLEWQDLAQRTGREGDMSIFNYTNDPLVYTSFVEIPQKIKNEVINFVGVSNVTFSGEPEPIVNFIVTVTMSMDKASRLVKTLPVLMTAGEIPGGKVMFMYGGPMLSVEEFEALGTAFERATGTKVSVTAIG